MKNNKNYNKIFEEYKELKIKTFNPINAVFGKKIQGASMKPEDILRIGEVKEELKKGLEFLSDEQLKFLYKDNDTDMVASAVKILTARRLKSI